MREQSISKNEERFITEALRQQHLTPDTIAKTTTTTTTTHVNEDGTTRVTTTQENQNVSLTKPSHPIRIDGRSAFDYRNIQIQFSQRQSGHAEVTLGETRVCAVVSCFIAEPFVDRPTEGFLTFNTELSPMASQYLCEAQSGTHQFARKSDMAIELSRIIERSLRGSRAVDTEALCIVAGRQVWSLRVDLHVLDFNGNLTDCAHIAAVAALMHFRRPDVTIEGENIVVHSAAERDSIPLSIHHIPICVTFTFLDDGNIVCVDASLKEELIADGAMTIAMNIYEEVCAVQKAGGVPITVDQIIKCTKIAQVKAREITTMVQLALKTDQEAKKLSKTIEYKFQPAISTVRKRIQQDRDQQQQAMEDEILSDSDDDDEDDDDENISD